MGKLLIPLIIGLLLGVSGGGFFSVMQVSKQHATAIADAKKHGIKPAGDSTHAEGDSAHTAESEAHDTEATPVAVAHADTTHADTVHAVATAGKPGTTAEHGTQPHAAPASTPTVAASTPAPHAPGTPMAALETAAHQRRLAKIFSTMGAKDASRVLAQMTDHDVSIILGLLSDRQAAAILTNLPAPRAAALSAVQPRRGGTE